MGSSTAQHELGGSTCSDHENAKSFDYTEKKGSKTSKRSPQRQDLIFFFFRSIALDA